MKKLLSTTIAVGMLTTMSLTPAMADVAANALPVLNNATNAEVTIGNTNNMNIQIQGGQGSVGTLNWDSYNVGRDASVNYEFSAHNQTALNIVSATGGLSQIYGKITNSGCSGCGYAGTGKVILLNPNGVLFGDGANVNLNSFTVSNMDGVYANNQLQLTKGVKQTDEGIRVLSGAKIYGDKNVTFAANNINVYKGSQISTNTAANVGDTAYGKVKLVTADGVNFTYYNNGAVREISGVKNAADKLDLTVNGDVRSGNIDIRNYSTHKDAELNLNDVTLKATKAVKGNDGNIWLIAPNKVVAENANLITVNADGAENVAGGNVVATAGNKVSIGSSAINAVGDVKLTSQNNDVVVDAVNVTTPKDVILTAGNKASIQNNSTVNANDVTINGAERAQIVSSKVNAKNVTLNGKNAWFGSADVTAAKEIKANGTDGYVWSTGSKLKGEKITLTASGDVKGDVDVQKSELAMYAGNDVNMQLKNVDNRDKGIVAEAGQNVTVETDGTLSVSRLVAKKGDMNIKADKVIAGLPFTGEEKIPNGDLSPRSYIYVANGKFNSNTANDSFDVTASDTLINDGTAQLRHHIQYGNGAEKILLINPRPYTPEPQPQPQPQPVVNNPDVDADRAGLVNKLPRQPEIYNNVTKITNNKTALVDVFAAAAQIEIEEDEE